MGNQQSKPPSRSTTQHERDDKQQRLDKEREREQELLREREGERERQRALEREREKERKVYRRISFQGLPHGKATAADPSATTESTLAQTISQPPAQNQTLHQHLHAVHSHSPEQSGKSIALVERSIPPGDFHEGHEVLQYRAKENPVPQPIAEANAEPSIPMDVPGCTNSRNARNSREGSVSTNPSPPPSTPQYTPISSLQRPPRLPLAIADEVRAPESPLLEATGVTDEEVSIFDDDEADLPRRNSALSSATAEDEDVGNELQPYAVDTGGVKVVPTRIDWKGSGERVYVTGTFAHWDKKFRLHQSEKGEGMTATIGFPPGTHHLKFIVDGEMVPSPDLPTTVDIHNVLVNYIEVVADEPPRGRRESGQKTKVIPPDLYPPIVLPEEEDLDSEDENTERDGTRAEPLEEEIPIGDFRQLMPQALTDMDLPEDDSRFRQAYNIIHDTPGPPSLPLFLGKSILNGVLPHKDDNSVLTLPNHTVLNHLATSSIKNGVLATSVTTRYKKKYVTTIMYKPTFEAVEA